MISVNSCRGQTDFGGGRGSLVWLCSKIRITTVRGQGERDESSSRLLYGAEVRRRRRRRGQSDRNRGDSKKEKRGRRDGKLKGELMRKRVHEGAIERVRKKVSILRLNRGSEG